MSATDKKSLARLKRKRRIRKKVIGSQMRPRLCVFRSARHIYVQVIDDTAGRTLASASSLEPTVKDHPRFDNKKALAVFVGKLIGERVRAQGISKVVFDRNGFLYHGRVKAVSDGAREAGLEF
jgi:large subunit ribosomal protein L18